MITVNKYVDKYGRQVQAGDVIKVFHYTDRVHGKHIFMYKLVIETDCHLNLNKNGDFLSAVDIGEIWKFGLDKAHKCNMICLHSEEYEIVDGEGYWYERPRKAVPNEIKS